MTSRSRGYGYHNNNGGGDDTSSSSDSSQDNDAPKCGRPVLDVDVTRAVVLVPSSTLRNVVYTIVLNVENIGTKSLAQVEASLSLQNVFSQNNTPINLATLSPAAQIQVTSTFGTVNALYNGRTVIQLLRSGAVLPSGVRNITVRVTFTSTVSQSLADVRLVGGTFGLVARCDRLRINETAILPADNAVPSLSVQKRYCDGADGSQVAVGQTASFVVTVTNTGIVGLDPSSVVLTDTYDPAHWSFVSATPAPTVITTDAPVTPTVGYFALKQGNNVSSLAGTAIPVAAGSSVYVGLSLDNSRTVTSVADNQSHTFTRVTNAVNGALRTELWYYDGVTASGAFTVTATFSGSCDVVMEVVEIVGAASPSLNMIGGLVSGNSRTPTVQLSGSANSIALMSVVSANDGTQSFSAVAPIPWITANPIPPLSGVQVAGALLQRPLPTTTSYLLQAAVVGRGTSNVQWAACACTILGRAPTTSVSGVGVPSPGTLTWSPLDALSLGDRSLDPAETIVACVTLRAMAQTPGLATTPNTAVATANGGAVVSPPSTVSLDITPPPTQPSVTVVKTLCTEPDAAVEDEVAFTVSVLNSGDALLENVVLTDTFDPAVLGFLGASVAPSSTSPAGTLTWTNLDALMSSSPLPLGDALSLRLRFRALAPSVSAINRADVTARVVGSPAVLSNTSSASLAISDVPNTLTITKTRCADPSAPVAVGSLVSFSLAVHNAGPHPADGVTLLDQFDPLYLEFVEATVAPSAIDTVGGVLTWTPFEWLAVDGPLGPVSDTDPVPENALPANATAVVCVTFRALLATPNEQTTVNTAVVSAPDSVVPAGPSSVSFPVVLVPPPAQLVLSKSLCSESPVCVGDEVHYTLTLTNAGGAPLTLVEVDDRYDPLALLYESASFAPFSTSLNAPAPPTQAPEAVALIRWTSLEQAAFAGPLMPGDSIVLHVRFRALLGGSPPAGLATTNYARAAALEAPGTGDYDASAAVNVTAPAALTAVRDPDCVPAVSGFVPGSTCDFAMADVQTARVRFVGAFETAVGGGVDGRPITPLRVGDTGTVVTAFPLAPTDAFASQVVAQAAVAVSQDPMLGPTVFTVAPGSYLPDGTLQWQVDYVRPLRFVSSAVADLELTDMELRFEAEFQMPLQESGCAVAPTRRIFSVHIQPRPCVFVVNEPALRTVDESLLMESRVFEHGIDAAVPQYLYGLTRAADGSTASVHAYDVRDAQHVSFSGDVALPLPGVFGVARHASPSSTTLATLVSNNLSQPLPGPGLSTLPLVANEQLTASPDTLYPPSWSSGPCDGAFVSIFGAPGTTVRLEPPATVTYDGEGYSIQDATVLWDTGVPNRVESTSAPGSFACLGFGTGNLSGAQPQRWSAVPFSVGSNTTVTSVGLSYFLSVGTPLTMEYKIFERSGLAAPGAIVSEGTLGAHRPVIADPRLPASIGGCGGFRLFTPLISLAAGDYYFTAYPDAGGAVVNAPMFIGASQQPSALEQSFQWRSAAYPSPGFVPFTLTTFASAPDPNDVYNTSFVLYQPGTTTSSIVVPSGIVTSASMLRVTLDSFSHSHMGELAVRLTCPGGTTTLFESANYLSASLVGPAPFDGGVYEFVAAGGFPPLSEISANPAGTYSPSDASNVTHDWSGLTFPFSAAGTWTLTIEDRAAGRLYSPFVPVSDAFEDIYTTGLLLMDENYAGAGLNDDGFVTGVAIGFPFNFAGTVVSTVDVSINGVLAPLGGFVASADGQNATRIAPYGHDLFLCPGSGAAVHSQTLGAPGSRRCIIQWSNTQGFGSCGTSVVGGYFQAVLFESTHRIQFRYSSIFSSPTFANVANVSLNVGLISTDTSFETQLASFTAWHVSLGVPAAAPSELATNVPIGFPFPYWDQTLTALDVNVHGRLGVGMGTVSTGPAPNTMTVLGMPLVLSGPTSRVVSGTFGSSPSRTFVVEWHDVCARPTPATVDCGLGGTFQAVLHETTGCIEYRYGSVTTDATVPLAEMQSPASLGILTRTVPTFDVASGRCSQICLDVSDRTPIVYFDLTNSLPVQALSLVSMDATVSPSGGTPPFVFSVYTYTGVSQTVARATPLSLAPWVLVADHVASTSVVASTGPQVGRRATVPVAFTLPVSALPVAVAVVYHSVGGEPYYTNTAVPANLVWSTPHLQLNAGAVASGALVLDPRVWSGSWAYTIAGSPGHVLSTLDLATGLLTDTTAPAQDGDVVELAHRPQDGALFGLLRRSNSLGSDSVVSIDPVSGVCTVIRDLRNNSGPGGGRILPTEVPIGLTFRPDIPSPVNSFYYVWVLVLDSVNPNAGALYSVNVVTGYMIDYRYGTTTNMPHALPLFDVAAGTTLNALSANSSGHMYAAYCDSSCDPNAADVHVLITEDPATLHVVKVARTSGTAGGTAPVLHTMELGPYLLTSPPTVPTLPALRSGVSTSVGVVTLGGIAGPVTLEFVGSFCDAACTMWSPVPLASSRASDTPLDVYVDGASSTTTQPALVGVAPGPVGTVFSMRVTDFVADSHLNYVFTLYEPLQHAAPGTGLCSTQLCLCFRLHAWCARPEIPTATPVSVDLVVCVTDDAPTSLSLANPLLVLDTLVAPVSTSTLQQYDLGNDSTSATLRLVYKGAFTSPGGVGPTPLLRADGRPMTVDAPSGDTASQTLVVSATDDPSGTTAALLASQGVQFYTPFTAPVTSPVPAFSDIRAESGVQPLLVSGVGMSTGSSTTVPLPFAFCYYGTAYTSVDVHTYGHLIFGPSAASSRFAGEAARPSTDAPNGYVAPLWDDYEVNGGSIHHVVRGTAPALQFVVQWTDMSHAAAVPAGSVCSTFQVLLNESDGSVLFLYGPRLDRITGADRLVLTSSTSRPTVGMENVTGNQGVWFEPSETLTPGTVLRCSPLAAQSVGSVCAYPSITVSATPLVLSDATLPDPLAISGCGLWLDASDAGTRTETVPGFVEEWRDKSPAARHFSQSSLPQRPRIVTLISDLGNATAIRFTGAEFLARVGSVLPASASAYTVCAVWRVSQSATGAGRMAVFDQSASVAASGRRAALVAQAYDDGVPAAANQGLYGFSGETHDAAAVAPLVVEQWEPSVMRVTATNGIVRITDHSLAARVGLVPSAPLDVDTGVVTLGAKASAWGSERFRGDVAEMLVYTRALSDAEVQSVGLYFQLRYGVPAGQWGFASRPANQGTGTVQAVFHGGLGPQTPANASLYLRFCLELRDADGDLLEQPFDVECTPQCATIVGNGGSPQGSLSTMVVSEECLATPTSCLVTRNVTFQLGGNAPAVPVLGTHLYLEYLGAFSPGNALIDPLYLSPIAYNNAPVTVPASGAIIAATTAVDALTVFEATLSGVDFALGTGVFSFQLLQPLDHHDSLGNMLTHLFLRFRLVASDAAGCRAYGTPFSVEIGDAAPSPLSAAPTTVREACLESGSGPSAAPFGLQTSQVLCVESSGMTAPGTAGATFTLASTILAVGGSTDRVFFRAGLTGGDVTGSANNEGIWSGTTTGDVALIVREGQTAVPSVPGAVFGPLITNVGTRSTGSGDNMLFGLLFTGPGITTNVNNSGLFLVDSTGAITMMARRRDQAPSLVAGTLFNTQWQPGFTATANANNHVAFLTVLLGGDAVTTPVNNSNAVYAGPAGSLVLVARRGDLLEDGLRLSNFLGNVKINANNQVLFDVALSGTGVTGANDVAFYLYTPSGGPVAAYGFENIRIVRRGDAAPGTVGARFASIAIVQRGFTTTGMLFTALLNSGDSVVGVNNTGLFHVSFTPPYLITLVVRGGSVAPGTGGALFSGFDSNNMLLRSDGAIIVPAILVVDGVLVTSATRNGHWIGTIGSGLTQLAFRAGDVMPGTGGGLINTDTLTNIGHVNSSLKIVFQTTLVGGPSPGGRVVGVWDAMNGVRLLLREGEMFEVQPGVFKTIFSASLSGNFDDTQDNSVGLSATGVLALFLRFTDLTNAVLRVPVCPSGTVYPCSVTTPLSTFRLGVETPLVPAPVAGVNLQLLSIGGGTTTTPTAPGVDAVPLLTSLGEPVVVTSAVGHTPPFVGQYGLVSATSSDVFLMALENVDFNAGTAVYRFTLVRALQHPAPGSSLYLWFLLRATDADGTLVQSEPFYVEVVDSSA